MTVIWGIAGAFVLVGLMVSARLMRSGRTTFAETRDKYHSRFKEGEKQLQNDAKKITLDEQTHILECAIKDLLRLDGNRPEFSLRRENRTQFVLGTPRGDILISFSMREQTLHATKKVLHGHERWQIEAFGLKEEFVSIAALMTKLNEILHDEDDSLPPEMVHLARRFRHRRAQPSQIRRSGIQ